MLDNAAFTQKWEAQGRKGESENEVYFDEVEQRWHKRNSLAFHATYLEFFNRVHLHNALFPEAPLRFEGFVEHAGALEPVFSQAHVKGARNAGREVVEPVMKAKGFLRMGDTDDYYNPHAGIRVEDLHDENALIGEDGRLYIIDPVPYLDERGKADRLYDRANATAKQPRSAARRRS